MHRASPASLVVYVAEPEGWWVGQIFRYLAPALPWQLMTDAVAITWRDLWRRGTEALGDRLEARRLVERTSGLDGAALLSALDEPAPARTHPFFDAMVERRRAGEPLQYVLGRWGFRRLDLFIDQRVLIPRPETEQVVEVALEALRSLGVDRPLVADLGTGSGAIALAVADEMPSARVWATDASPDALAVARANLTGLGTLAAPRVMMCQGDWFAALPGDLCGRLHMVISNPPYVATDSGTVPDPEVADWEPPTALFSGPDGLDDVRRIVAEAGEWLARPGLLALEVGSDQTEAVTDLCWSAGAADVSTHHDLAGRPRAVVARW